MQSLNSLSNSRLLSLPSDIRVIVYQQLFDSISLVPSNRSLDLRGTQDLSGVTPSNHSALSILQTCRLIYSEAFALLYRGAIMRVASRADVISLLAVWHPGWRYLRHLTLTFPALPYIKGAEFSHLCDLRIIRIQYTHLLVPHTMLQIARGDIPATRRKWQRKIGARAGIEETVCPGCLPVSPAARETTPAGQRRLTYCFPTQSQPPSQPPQCPHRAEHHRLSSLPPVLASTSTLPPEAWLLAMLLTYGIVSHQRFADAIIEQLAAEPQYLEFLLGSFPYAQYLFTTHAIRAFVPPRYDQTQGDVRNYGRRVFERVGPIIFETARRGRVEVRVELDCLSASVWNERQIAAPGGHMRRRRAKKEEIQRLELEFILPKDFWDGLL